FVWPKHDGAPEAPTDQVSRALRSRNQTAVPDSTHSAILRWRAKYRSFHSHFLFPEAFADPGSRASARLRPGWTSGFDAVVGNPLWDSVNFPETEFFAVLAPEIAEINNTAARKKKIQALKENPDTVQLYSSYMEAKRRVYGESHFLRISGRHPLTGQGNLNVYSLFTENDRALTSPHGRTGVIVPTGIATDARTQHFFKDLVASKSLAALIDFENRKSIFPAIDSRMKFCILSMTGTNIDQPVATFGFFLHDPAELADSGKTFSLTADEINLLNPNTGTCPVFRSRRDAEITLGIYERVPVLRDESKGANGNSWGISFLRMFDMSHESHLFRPDIQNGESFDDLLKDGWRLEGNLLVRGKERLLPLYEAKMADFYNHRVADVVKSETATKRQNQPRYLTERDLDDPDRLPLPSNWVPESDVIIAGRPYKGVAKRLFDQGWDS